MNQGGKKEQGITNTTPLDAHATLFSYMMSVEPRLNVVSVSAVSVMSVIMDQSSKDLNKKIQKRHISLQFRRTKWAILLRLFYCCTFCGISLLWFHEHSSFSKVSKTSFLEWNKSLCTNEENRFPVT